MTPLIRHKACLLVLCLVISMLPDIHGAKPIDGPSNKNKNKTKRPPQTQKPTTTPTTTTTTTTQAPEPPGIACITDREPPRAKSNKTKKSNKQGKGLRDDLPGYSGVGPAAVTQRLSACSIKMDLLFIIDGSFSVGYDNFISTIHGVSDLINWLYMSEADGVRVGFIIFGTVVTYVHPFSADAQAVSNALEAVEYPASGTYTHLAIEHAIYMFTTTGRADAEWLIILITDGRSEKPSKTMDSFNTAKSLNIKVAAVGVTKSARQSEVYSSVSKNMQHFAKDFDQFRDKVDNFLDKVCGFITR